MRERDLYTVLQREQEAGIMRDQPMDGRTDGHESSQG